ncbi:class I adenylate-forming enzyme family protein [Nocardia seriolae]|uniref:Long-chain-fatty-acid--CoA ligase n=2 Tax=Nocardia seriolae TaxID=37332 RepID=A0ABC8APK9_9NOCA|nr:AMP-binding protein [Nocardia seriolae]APA96082.1 Long-chain-fatty-acid--CoA ligase [Nocardia seriolae]MTJ65839.1 AMP-binding protein [Nocardia seriolae]MTJ72368.1 AMP-binding protein [Nocardia seriolae]MTJ86231.1 AMP-binding protein [Nocardia seriolae]MTK30227.1 AMP-binding protein [Nocardia seriolae]
MSQLLVEYPHYRNGRRENPLARAADGILRYGNLTPALTELLDIQVHTFAAREAVVEIGGPRLTYRELWYSASRIAGGLQEHGIGYGDRVAVRMPVGARWVQAFLGALLSGAVPVLVHDGLPDAVAERVIRDACTDFVLDGGGRAAGFGEALPDAAAFIDDGASLGELALLCYTTGAETGPRGVELTNENLLSAIRSVIGALELPTDGLRNLVLLPLAHASGCVDQLLPTFAVGGTVVLTPDRSAVPEALVAERIDMISATPRVFAGLLPDLAGLRVEQVRQVCSAGHRAELAAADPDVSDAVSASLREVFPAARQWSVWGATETSGIGLARDDDAAGRDTLGFAFGGTELALWGPRAAADHGELLCRGPNVTPRYWNDPQTTQSRFTGSWFHTGNQVSIDADGLVRRAAAD